MENSHLLILNVPSVDMKRKCLTEEDYWRNKIANELKEWNVYEGVFADGITAAIRKVESGISNLA